MDILDFYPKNPWLGQYVREEHLPDLPENELKKFVLEAFWPNLPWLYATNKKVLEEVKDFISKYGVHSIIEEFHNMECRYVLRCNSKLYNALGKINKVEKFNPDNSFKCLLDSLTGNSLRNSDIEVSHLKQLQQYIDYLEKLVICSSDCPSIYTFEDLREDFVEDNN